LENERCVFSYFNLRRSPGHLYLLTGHPVALRVEHGRNYEKSDQHPIGECLEDLSLLARILWLFFFGFADGKVSGEIRATHVAAGHGKFLLAGLSPGAYGAYL